MRKNNLFFNLLVEGTRDKLFQKYVDILAQRGVEMTPSQLKDFMRKKLTTEAGINALSLPSSYFLSGATKLYFNGELTTNKRLSVLYPKLNIKDKFDFVKCKKLNKIIIDLRNMYIDSEGQQWDVPEDFGELSLDQIIKKYKKFLKGENFDDEAEKEDGPIDTHVGNYTFDILYNHKIAEKYGPYTIPYQWCITQAGNDTWYNKYQRDNGTHFVVFRRNGFENEKQVVDNSKYPLDKYGTSLLAAQLKNKDGSFYCCTSRWNHGSYASQDGEAPYIPDADFAVSWDDFQKITGCTETTLSQIQKEWLKNRETKTEDTLKGKNELVAMRQFKYISICINNGQNPIAGDNPMLRNIRNIELISVAEDGKCSSIKGSDKWNKGLKAAQLMVNGESYMSIIDNGKLKPSTTVRGNLYSAGVLSNLRYRLLRNPDVNNEQVRMLNRFVIVKHYDSTRNRNRFRLYDTKTHSIISIGGKTLFENQYGIAKKRYFFIKIGTKQYSILDLQTGNILKADDGTDVFEAIIKIGDYDGGKLIKDKYDIDTNDDLMLIGDSAQYKCYLYNHSTSEITSLGDPLDSEQTVNIPALSIKNYKKSDFFIAGRDGFPDRVNSSEWSNTITGSFIVSKETNERIEPFGLKNPKSHSYFDKYELFGYRLEDVKNGTVSPYSYTDVYAIYIKGTGKFLELPDGPHLFYDISGCAYDNSDKCFTVKPITDGVRPYSSSWDRYHGKQIYVRVSDGAFLTKDGFKKNEYQYVLDYSSVRTNGEKRLYSVQFWDKTNKLHFDGEENFLMLDGKYSEFKDVSLWRDENLFVITTDDTKITFDSVEDFFSRLTPIPQISENFNRLSQYKLKLL